VNQPHSKIAFLFPGQGAQYPGMGKDFAETYSIARQTFEEADDLLGFNLSSIAFEGPEDRLTETRHSQLAIFVTSVATQRTLKQLFPGVQPVVCAGLSLGEYSALTVAGYLDFSHCLQLVQYRAQYMNEACEQHTGTMAAIMGLSGSEVEEVISALKLPNDLWIANYNAPGQIVISGTVKGIEVGGQALKDKGAKRVLPLQVHGAFHSGLMQSAMEKLRPHVEQVVLAKGSSQLVMNVPGDFVAELPKIQQYLVQQVVSPVRWEQGIRAIQEDAIDIFIEIGCGKTLAGLNKRIGVAAPTVSVDKVEDLKQLEERLSALVC
jgi:[acyl-carrier-protein] S-malonyltransferase